MDATNSDTISRGILSATAVRVVVVTSTHLAREASRRHGAEGGVAVAMGRAATAGFLLATLTKGDERVTLQLLGAGPLGSVAVDASASGDARVYVKNPRVRVAVGSGRVALRDVLGPTGVVNVVRDLGMRETFGGQTDFVDGEIDTDVEQYLIKSEQIDSAVGCEVLLTDDLKIRASAGILLQALPGSDGADVVAHARERLRAGALSSLLLRNLGSTPPHAAEVVAAVLGDLASDVTILDTRPVRFFCACSREKAAWSIALLGAQDVAEMLSIGQAHTVTCEFCRAAYSFGTDDLGPILAQLEKRQAESS